MVLSVFYSTLQKNEIRKQKEQTVLHNLSCHIFPYCLQQREKGEKKNPTKKQPLSLFYPLEQSPQSWMHLSVVFPGLHHVKSSNQSIVLVNFEFAFSLSETNEQKQEVHHLKAEMREHGLQCKKSPSHFHSIQKLELGLHILFLLVFTYKQKPC